VFFKMNM